MTRTRLRQLEQVISSETYNDDLNQHDNSGTATEGQPGGSITSSVDVVSITSTTKTIIVSGDITDLGVNSSDEITISSSGSGNDGIYTVFSISYSSPNSTIVVEEDVPSDEGAISGGAAFTVDPKKNLERELNHIRTQLKKLNQTSSWYEIGNIIPAYAYSSKTQVSVSEGTAVDVGFTYDAGDPYDLQVFLNGEQLIPSTISGTTVTTENDYQELDNDETNVSDGNPGRKVAFNFDILAGDVLQFHLSK